MANTVSYNDLLNTIKEVQSTVLGFGNDLAALYGQQTDAFKREQEALVKKGDATTEIAVVDEQIKKERQDIMQTKAAGLGTSASAKDTEAVRIIGEQLLQAQSDVQAGRKDLAERASVSPADDMFGWLGYQIGRPFLEDEQIKREAVAAGLAEDLSKRLALTTQMAAATKAIDEGTNAARVAAVGKQKMAETELAVAQAQAKAAEAGMTATSLRSANSLKQVQLSQATYQATVEQQRLVLSERADARAARELQLREEAQQWARAEKEEKKFNEKLVLDRANAVMRALGKNEFEDIRRIEMLPAAQKTELIKAMSDVNLATGTLGMNPLQALETLRAFGGNVPENMREGVSFARAAEQRTLEEYDKRPQVIAGQAPKFRQLPKDQQFNLIQEGIQAELQKQRTVINPTDTGNIYNPVKVSALLKAPIFAADPVMQKLVPMVTSESYMLRPQDVLEAAKAAGFEGSDAAVRVAKIYQRINQITAEDKQFLKMGIPPATGYVTQMEMPGMWAKPMNVDWTKPTSIENYLLRTQKDLAPGIDMQTSPEYGVFRGEMASGRGKGKSGNTGGTRG